MFQKIDKEFKGYQLYDHGSYYELHSPFGIYRGNLSQVTNHAVIELGFEFKEIELGVLELERNFDDLAEFGVMRTFMYTTSRRSNVLH